MKKFFNNNWVLIFGTVLIAGFFLRLVYASHLPVINDEGSYLYDGLLLSQGKWPFNYSFSRSPALMFLVAPTVGIFGRSYIAGRVISICAGLASSVVLYFLGKKLFSFRVGFTAFLMYALLAPAVVHTSYLLTQPLELLLVLSGIYFAWLGIEARDSAATVMWGVMTRFVLSGVFFGLSVLTRETAAFYPVAMVLAILFFSAFRITDNELRISSIAKGIFDSFIMGISSLAVWAGVWTIIISQVGYERVKAVFLAITSMHDTGEYWSFGFKLRKKWEIFYGVRWENFILYALTAVFAVVLVLKIAEWLRKGPGTTWGARFGKEKNISGLIFFLCYAAVPIVFYGLYYRRFQAEYLAEFMPVFVLMGAVAVDFLTICVSKYCSSGLQSALERVMNREINFATSQLVWVFIMLLVLPLLFFNYRYMYHNHHGGTFAPEALDEATEFVRANVPKDEEIFTAAVIIPFLADRPLAFNMSRPVIFGYPHLDPDIKYTLFPSDQEILIYLEEKPVNWAIFDRTTWETFSRGHPELEKYLEDTYNIVHTIPNKRTGTFLEIGTRVTEYTN